MLKILMIGDFRYLHPDPHIGMDTERQAVDV